MDEPASPRDRKRLTLILSPRKHDNHLTAPVVAEGPAISPRDNRAKRRTVLVSPRSLPQQLDNCNCTQCTINGLFPYWNQIQTVIQNTLLVLNRILPAKAPRSLIVQSQVHHFFQEQMKTISKLCPFEATDFDHKENPQNITYGNEGLEPAKRGAPATLYSASIPKLIEVVTSPEQRLKFLDMSKVLILTYPEIFGDSLTLFAHLLARIPKNQPKKKLVSIHVASFIKKWTEENWYEFQKCPILISACICFLLKSLFESNLSVGQFLLTLIGQYLTDSKIKFYSFPSSERIKNFDNFFFLKYKVKYLVEQFSLIDWKLLSNIPLVEFFSLNWTKEKKFFSETNHSPNIMLFLNRMTQMSFLFSYLILSTEDLNRRRKVFIKVLKMGMGLFEVGNLNGAVCVLEALDNPAVARLTQTKRALDKNKKLKQKYDTLKEFTQEKKLRAIVKDKVCIPPLSIYLMELAFTKCNIPKKVKEMENISRLRNMHFGLNEFSNKIKESFELIQYLQENPEISKFFYKFDHDLDPKILSDMSVTLEK